MYQITPCLTTKKRLAPAVASRSYSRAQLAQAVRASALTTVGAPPRIAGMRALLTILIPMIALAGVMTLVFWASGDQSEPNRPPSGTTTAVASSNGKSEPKVMGKARPSAPARTARNEGLTSRAALPPAATQAAVQSLSAAAEAVDDLANITRVRAQHDRTAQLVAARQALATSRPAEAVAAADRILAVNPDDVEALSAKALGLVGLTRLAEAAALLERALKVSPDDVRLRYNLAMIQTRLGMFSEAIRGYEAVLAKQPEHAKAAYNLAQILQDEGKLSDAAKLWERVTASSPDLASGWFNWGLTSLQLGEFETAAKAFAHADQLEPNRVDTLSNLGTAYQGAGKPVEAITIYRRAQEIRRDYLPAINGMAEVYLGYFEKHPDAGDQLECALQWCDYSFRVKADQPRLAVLYNRVLKTRPDCIPALNGLARILSTGKPGTPSYEENRTKAIEMCRKSLMLSADQPAVTALLERLTAPSSAPSRP
jgi:tetratricopeptide (TPR) repeat protein